MHCTTVGGDKNSYLLKRKSKDTLIQDLIHIAHDGLGFLPPVWVHIPAFYHKPVDIRWTAIWDMQPLATLVILQHQSVYVFS